MKRILLALLLLAMVPGSASACELYKRLYATAATLDFCLWEPDGTDLMTTASIAAGEVKVALDEGAEANCSNGSGACVTDEGSCYSISLTSSEMTASRVYVTLIDTATKTFLDQCLIIETYGHASAQHTTPAVDVTKWSGTAVASPDTAGYPKVTIKDGTGTGEIDTDAGSVTSTGGGGSSATRKW